MRHVMFGHVYGMFHTKGWKEFFRQKGIYVTSVEGANASKTYEYISYQTYILYTYDSHIAHAVSSDVNLNK